jgi:hypothetical protein
MMMMSRRVVVVEDSFMRFIGTVPLQHVDVAALAYWHEWPEYEGRQWDDAEFFYQLSMTWLQTLPQLKTQS